MRLRTNKPQHKSLRQVSGNKLDEVSGISFISRFPRSVFQVGFWHIGRFLVFW